jgi:predicted 2-oxoglutarate/Fe(II)-dependent dioxygenase YbiX
MKLLDYVKVYDADPERLARVFAAVKSLPDWDQHSWYNAAAKATHSHETKELYVRAMLDSPAVLQDCRQWVVNAIESYANDIGMEATITSISNPRLNKYPAGTMMRSHVDHIHTLFDGELKGIPAISLVAVLNDDYKGGDLVICGQPYRLKPGQIIVWPSCFLYPHEVTEVTAGTRYSFVSWAW